MVELKWLRLSAVLLFAGEVLSALAQLPHPAGGPTYEATFANYAASRDWDAVHLVQFACAAIFLAGLLALFFALNISEGGPRLASLFGAAAAGVALVLASIVGAVDGVALKQAVDAWAHAPAAEQAARFASAEAIRWLEWGTNSYWYMAQGLALVLYAAAIVWTARVPRPIGYLMGLSGFLFISLGWLVGIQGFTVADTLPTYAVHGLNDIWMIWLLLITWRRKELVQAAVGQGV